MRPINQINREVAIEYLQSADLAALEPEEIENELLPLLQNSYKEENATADKGERIKIPNTLPDYIIKMIFEKKYETINLYPNTDLNGYCILMVYDKGEGIYKDDEKTLNAMINRFNNSILPSSIKTIKDKLSYDAKKVSESTSTNIIACNNGIFNTSTCKLERFNPNVILTSKLATNYNPNAKNVYIKTNDGSTWDVDSWLDSLCDTKLFGKDFILHLIKAMITPKCPWNKAFCLYNPTGNNGKGTFCQLIRNLIGESYCKSLKIEDFSKEFYLESLAAKTLAVITDEAKTERIKNAANFKALITHDPIEINRKHKDILTLRKEISMLFCVNELPYFDENTEALSRRLVYIPFTNCFKGRENKDIKNEYIYRKDVLEYILFKVLSLPEINEFPEPTPCILLKDKLYPSGKKIDIFIKEVLPQTKWKLLPYDFLYDLFIGWYFKTSSVVSKEIKSDFGVVLRKKLERHPEYKWCTTGQPTRNLLNIPEPLIIEYDLKNWMNQDAKDLNARCTPVNVSSSYTGIIKR